jgi:hypothetical protein
VDPVRAKVMHAVQQALAGSTFTDVMGVPARKSLPSWCLVATQDQAIPPDAERLFASRMRATTIEVPASHVAMVSHRAEVTQLITAADAGGAEMSNDVIIGHDGKPRCAWAGADDTAFGRYHDEVWGTRTHDESAMFEALTLGVFEVGLSWSIVFGKRDAFRKAFLGFHVAKVAAMTERDIDRLVQDASIIRNRAKIQATVDNARAMMTASPSS